MFYIDFCLYTPFVSLAWTNAHVVYVHPCKETLMKAMLASLFRALGFTALFLEDGIVEAHMNVFDEQEAAQRETRRSQLDARLKGTKPGDLVTAPAKASKP